MRQLGTVLALGLGIEIWFDVALGEELLVHLGREDGDLVVLVVLGGVAEWVDVETRGSMVCRRVGQDAGQALSGARCQDHPPCGRRQHQMRRLRGMLA